MKTKLVISTYVFLPEIDGVIVEDNPETSHQIILHNISTVGHDGLRQLSLTSSWVCLFNFRCDVAVIGTKQNGL